MNTLTLNVILPPATYTSYVDYTHINEAILSNLELKNVKFLSSHNTFVLDLQMGGTIGYDAVEEMIGYAKKMPVCIEIDISRFSSYDINNPDDGNKIYVDHHSRSFTPTYLQKLVSTPSEVSLCQNPNYNPDFNCVTEYHTKLSQNYNIRSVFLNIKEIIKTNRQTLGLDLFPIILSIDTSHVTHYIIKKIREIYEESAVFGGSDLNPFNKLEQKDRMNYNIPEDTSLLKCMNTVSLRYYDINTETLSHINKSTSKEIYINKGTKQIYKPKGEKVQLFRSYPSFFIYSKSILGTLQYCDLVSTGSKQLSKCNNANICKQKPELPSTKDAKDICNLNRSYGVETYDYQLLNIKIISDLIYGDNNYNMASFNLHDVKQYNKTDVLEISETPSHSTRGENIFNKLISDFTQLYKSMTKVKSLRFEKAVSLGGGGRRKQPKSKRKKRKSNRKRRSKRKRKKTKKYSKTNK